MPRLDEYLAEAVGEPTPTFGLADVQRRVGRRRRRRRITIGVSMLATVVVVAAGLVSLERQTSPVTVTRPSPVTVAGPRPEGWRRVPRGPLSARENAHAFWTGSEVLVVGGSDAPPCPPNASCVLTEGQSFRDGAALDPGTGVWRPIARAPVPLRGFTGVVVRGDLYLLAPESNLPGAARSAFVVYRVVEDRWEELAEVPATGFGLVSAGGRIVAYATTEERGDRPDLVFDLEARAWGELPDDPLSPSFDRTMVWAGDRLVLFGIEAVPSPPSPGPGSGKPGVYRAATYDFGTKQWRRLPDSEIAGYDPLWYWIGRRVVNPTLGAANNRGRSYPYGGILDPAAGRWSPLPDPPSDQPQLDAGQFFWLVAASDRVAVNGQGWLYDATRNRWTIIPRPEGAPEQGFTSVWTDAGLFVFGGATWKGGRGSLLADGWLWSPPRLTPGGPRA